MSKLDHTKNIIEVKDICFSYGTEEVLTDITLNVHQGDYLGVVGPNGAGKTTLLKIMLGILVPKKGIIKLFCQDVKNFKDWHKIGYVPQKTTNFDANFPATVEEAVMMGRFSVRGLLRRINNEDRKIVQTALSQVNMEEYKNRLIGDLSGGQLQKVFIARALAANPEVIFLDEPTAGVDQKSQDEFYDLLRKLNKEMGLTLVLVTHDIEAVTREAMHIACIDQTLVSHTSPEEFLKESETADIFGQKVKIIAHHHHKN